MFFKTRQTVGDARKERIKFFKHARRTSDLRCELLRTLNKEMRHLSTTREGVDAVCHSLSTEKLGRVHMIEAIREGFDAEVIFYGDQGVLSVNGSFNWGYSGTGPMGLIEVMTLCGVPQEAADRRVRTTPQNQNWRVIL